MALKTFGSMQVDWEQRVDFERLRRERLARVKALLKRSEMGALLCFDMNNVRYITATHIGTWAQDKINRFNIAIGERYRSAIRRLDDIAWCQQRHFEGH